jgi:Ran GTPase-activating protein (RanGAP) involved in mRNA processing and transport
MSNLYRKVSYDLERRLGLDNFSTNLIKYILGFFTLNEIIELRKVCKNLYKIISNLNIFKEYINMIKKITVYPKNITDSLFKDNAIFITKNTITNYLTDEEKDYLYQNYLHFFLRENKTIYFQDHLRVGENGFYFLSIYLKFFKCKIRNLKANYNMISEESCTYLARALCHNTTLFELHLNGTNLSPEACNVLGQSLAMNRTLERLEFSYNNNLRTESLEALVPGLKVNESITTLFLCDNLLRVDGAKSIADLVKHNKRIRNLYIERNELDDEGVTYIAMALPYNNSIECINLSENRITNQGLGSLVENLGVSELNNSSINKLFLKSNAFSNIESARLIGRLIEVNRSLRYLDLSNNGLSDQIIQPIADAIRVNRTLESLIFESNVLGGSGTRILCEGIRVNRSLKLVNLRNNGLGYEGAKAIAAMLDINRTVTHLNLQANMLDEHGITLIADKLNYNTVLKSLILSNNQVTNIRDILDNVSFAKEIITY